MSLPGYNTPNTGFIANVSRSLIKGNSNNTDRPKYQNVSFAIPVEFDKQSSNNLEQLVNKLVMNSGASIIVYGFNKVSPGISAASNSRVDWVYVGDSNNDRTDSNGRRAGYIHGFSRKLFQNYGMYASHLIPQNAGGSLSDINIGATGYLASGAIAGSLRHPSFFTTGCNSDIASYYWTNNPLSNPVTSGVFTYGPGGYSWLPGGSGTIDENFHGIYYTSGCIQNPEQAFRVHLRTAIIASGDSNFGNLALATGKLYLHARKDQLGGFSSSFVYSNSVTGWYSYPIFGFNGASGSTTGSITTQLVNIYADVPSGTRLNDRIKITHDPYEGVGAPLNRSTTGPLFLGWGRIEFPNQSSGISYTPLWAQGGTTAQHFVTGFLNLRTHKHMQEYFGQLTRLQNTSRPKCVIHWTHMGNDAGVGSTSIYSGSIVSGINLFKSFWRSAGFNVNDLYFVLGPYHPTSYVTEQDSLATVLQQIVNSNDNVAAIEYRQLATTGNFMTSGWYEASELPLKAHLNASGYYHWGNIGMQALIDSTRLPLTTAGNSGVIYIRNYGLGDPDEIRLNNEQRLSTILIPGNSQHDLVINRYNETTQIRYDIGGRKLISGATPTGIASLTQTYVINTASGTDNGGNNTIYRNGIKNTLN